ncbi:MAG: flagellar motor switch protein FliN [Salinisphaeraceae bacterium]|nr:flagellar motor switch protein FliN [Salinisphaeraceae bacterium]
MNTAANPEKPEATEETDMDNATNTAAGPTPEELAQAAAFENLQPDNNGAEQPTTAATEDSHTDVNMDVILDVSVTLSMELGRARVPIRNLLQLNQGSVVELERMAGEPLDVYVNNTLIAHGEVVVVNDRFGVRLTDVVSPAERIRRLK